MERVALIVEGMCLETAVHGSKFTLHLADTRGKSVDEFAAKQRRGLVGRLAGLPLILPKLVGFDVLDELIRPGLHLLERFAFGSDLRAHSEIFEIMLQNVADAAFDPRAFGLGIRRIADSLGRDLAVP